MFGLRTESPATAPKLSDGDLKKLARRKPAQATILSQTTARRLAYLVRHRLANFRGSRFAVAMTRYRDFTGKLNKMPKGIVHGGV